MEKKRNEITLKEQKQVSITTALNNLYSSENLKTDDVESSEYVFSVLNKMGERNTKAIAFLVNHMKTTKQVGELPELVAFVKEKFDLEKSQFYNMVKVAEVFLINGALSIFANENGEDYTFTQLLKMLPRERSKKWSRVTLNDVKKLHDNGEISYDKSVKEIENIFERHFTEVLEVEVKDITNETETAETETEAEETETKKTKVEKADINRKVRELLDKYYTSMVEISIDDNSETAKENTINSYVEKIIDVFKW